MLPVIHILSIKHAYNAAYNAYNATYNAYSAYNAAYEACL